MLKKLLKYDFKSGIRIFGFMWIAIAVVTGLVTLIFSLMSNDSPAKMIAGTMTILPIALAIAGAVSFPYIFAAVRFHKGLLGREGYLMFTLPSSPWKLLTSKLISSLVFAVVTMMLSLLGVGIILRAIFSQLIRGDLGDFSTIMGSSGWDRVLTLINALITLTTGMLQIYVALCIGHLFRGKRVLWAVLIYFGISMVTSIISLVMEIVVLSNGDVATATDTVMYMSLPLNLGLGILYFFLSERILRTRLNLE